VRTLEIGPGTGQATVELLRRGGPVTAIELGHDLAARLVENVDDPRLRVVEGAFETVDLGDARFDLVAAATSFHWVPPATGLPRVADLLDAGGWVALWWNCFGDPTRRDPFHDALVPVLRATAPQLLEIASDGSAAAGHWYALDEAARAGEIDACGRFGPVHVELVRWTGRHTAAEARALFASFSPWLALDPEPRARVLDATAALVEDEFGGVVERPYVTPLYAAMRR